MKLLSQPSLTSRCSGRVLARHKHAISLRTAVEEETFIFTKKKRPVAALVSLRKVDRESLALSTNPQFLKIIETARKEVRAGKSISLETLEKKYGVKARNKKMERTRRTRRSS